MEIIEKVKLEKDFNITINNVKYCCNIKESISGFYTTVYIVKKIKWFNIEYNTFFGSMYIFDSDFPPNIYDIPEDNYIPIETAIYICKHAINKINSRTCIKHVKEIIVKETV